MKTLIALVTAALLGLGLVACGDQGAATAPTQIKAQDAGNTVDTPPIPGGSDNAGAHLERQPGDRVTEPERARNGWASAPTTPRPGVSRACPQARCPR